MYACTKVWAEVETVHCREKPEVRNSLQGRRSVLSFNCRLWETQCWLSCAGEMPAQVQRQLIHSWCVPQSHLHCHCLDNHSTHHLRRGDGSEKQKGLGSTLQLSLGCRLPR